MVLAAAAPGLLLLRLTMLMRHPIHPVVSLGLSVHEISNIFMLAHLKHIISSTKGIFLSS